MLSSAEIRNIKFSKAVGGYKQEEVDILLDKIEVDYDRFERTLAQKEARIAELENEINSMETSKESIQTVLLSAQKLADQIVADAKVKSEEIVKAAEGNIELITVRERELSSEFDRRANERKAKFDEEMQAATQFAEEKLGIIQKATEDSVRRQQALFNKLKLEVAAFKADITNKYREHLEILQKLPDVVTEDPEALAAAVEEIYSKKISAEEYFEEQTVAEETPEVAGEETEQLDFSDVNDAKAEMDSAVQIAEDDQEDY